MSVWRDLGFEWDRNKAKSNFTKHGVSFEEAATVFFDPLSLTIPDPDHGEYEEERCLILGLSEAGRLLVVAHCDRGDSIRIISARLATSSERRGYEE
jgi:hypothetical protein